MDILKLYKQILDVAGMTADDEGRISVQLVKSSKVPVLVGSKRLVLPTPEHLRNPDPDHRVVFHPLTESVLRGESEVMRAYREAVSKRLNFIFPYIALHLLQLATSPAQHQNLTPDQTVFMDHLKNVDEGTVDRMKDIVREMVLGDASRSFVHFFLRRNGEVAGEKFLRVGVVSFPFYEELKKIPKPKEPNEIYGVKLRKVDREALISLVEYMVPNITVPEAYNRGTNSSVAPSLVALMQTVVAIGDPINGMLEIFGELIGDQEVLFINGEWEEAFKDLPGLQRAVLLIPSQPGNEGSVNTAQANAVPQVAVPGVQVSKATDVAVAKPLQQQRPLSLAELASGAARPQGAIPQANLQATMHAPPAPVASASVNATHALPPSGPMTPQVIHQPIQQPMTFQPQPAPQMQQLAVGMVPGTMMVVQTPQGPMSVVVQANGQLAPVMQQQQPPPPIHTGRGLDAASFFAANPALAAATGLMQQPTGYGFATQPRDNTPRWARPNQGMGYGGI